MKFKIFTLLFLIVLAFFGISFATYESVLLDQKVAGLKTINKNIVRGIIVPHHDLAREYFIQSFDRLSGNNDYSYIVIFGPNHFYPSETNYLASSEVFDYQISSEMVNNLQISFPASLKFDKDKVEREHSFSVPAQYLRKYFPKAKFIPVVVPQNFDREEVSKIARYFAETLPQDTLYVASVDFAHDKMVLEAENNNKESIVAIRNFDFDEIYYFNSDHMDSPGSIGLLLSVMQNLGSTDLDVWIDSHGAFIEGAPLLQGTSYLFGVFTPSNNP